MAMAMLPSARHWAQQGLNTGLTAAWCSEPPKGYWEECPGPILCGEQSGVPCQWSGTAVGAPLTVLWANPNWLLNDGYL